jgi:hypothetical protein
VKYLIKVDARLNMDPRKLLSIKALTNPGCRLQFGCSVDRNNTTACAKEVLTISTEDSKYGRKINKFNISP